MDINTSKVVCLADGSMHHNSVLGSINGDTTINDGSAVIENATWVTYIEKAGHVLPDDAILRSFAYDYADLVQKFEERMYALEDAVDKASKSQYWDLPCLPVYRELDSLEESTNQNKAALSNAQNEHSAEIQERINWNIRILRGMHRLSIEAKLK